MGKIGVVGRIMTDMSDMRKILKICDCSQRNMGWNLVLTMTETTRNHFTKEEMEGFVIRFTGTEMMRNHLSEDEIEGIAIRIKGTETRKNPRSEDEIESLDIRIIDTEISKIGRLTDVDLRVITVFTVRITLGVMMETRGKWLHMTEMTISTGEDVIVDRIDVTEMIGTMTRIVQWS